MPVPVWIRSQDAKKLKLCNDIEVAEFSNGSFVAYAGWNTTYERALGFYSSTDKASKVLDMIQLFICGKYEDLKKMGYDYYKYGCSIFQMPADDEV